MDDFDNIKTDSDWLYTEPTESVFVGNRLLLNQDIKEVIIVVMNLHTLKRTIEISRPIFWPSSFFGFILGVLFSHHSINVPVIFFAFLWSFPFSLWICSVNDLADEETDAHNKHKGGLSGARVNKTEFKFVKKLQWISLFIIIIPTFLTGNYFLYLTSAAALIITYIYSARPVRLKERPPLDSLSNGATAIAVFMCGYVFYNPVHFDILFYQVALGFFFGVTAIHIIGALRDYIPDKTAHVKTIAVTWGKKKSTAFATVLFSLVYICIFNFPIEFRLYILVAIISTLILLVKPSERMSLGVLLLLMGSFFVVCAYSLMFTGGIFELIFY